MEKDRRRHPRYKPQGIKASITFENSPHDPLCINGEVLDISSTGIKIKLSTPLSGKLSGKIKILITLPDSGITLSITGIIKHQPSPSECALQYEDGLAEDIINDLMFECVKTIQPGKSS